MPMWFVPREGEIWIWTYAKSQKVRNLERDPRATLLVETGHEYGELRGAMIEAEAEIHSDFETVIGFAEELTLRYAEGISSVEGDAKAALEAQAPKRVAIRFGRCARPPGTTASSAAPTERPATAAAVAAVLQGDAIATLPLRNETETHRTHRRPARRRPGPRPRRGRDRRRRRPARRPNSSASARRRR